MVDWIRNIARAIALAASCAFLALLGGGLPFVYSPIGAAYTILWAFMGGAYMLGRPSGVKSQYDKGAWKALALLGIFLVAAFFGSAWEYANLPATLPRDGLLNWLGLLLFSVGLALQAWAMLVLHGGYTFRLGIQPGHKLVTTGPYAIVRHPGYFGTIVSMAGAGIAFGSVIGVASALLTAVSMVLRIKPEEKMLGKEFGKKYSEYKKRVKCLIPLAY